jgi:hypothetical protein
MLFFFPEQVDTAAGMSERSSAREPGHPARSSPAARAPQNSRHGRTAISCCYQCFGSGNRLDPDLGGPVDPASVSGSRQAKIVLKKGLRNCMLDEFSIGLEPSSGA